MASDSWALGCKAWYEMGNGDRRSRLRKEPSFTCSIPQLPTAEQSEQPTDNRLLKLSEVSDFPLLLRVQSHYHLITTNPLITGYLHSLATQ